MHLKPQPNAKSPMLVGDAGFQLCQGFGNEYLEYLLKETNTDWKEKWFYIGNHAPRLPARSGLKPEPRSKWLEELRRSDLIMSFVKKILRLKEQGLTGAPVVFSWLQRRIQPL